MLTVVVLKQGELVMLFIGCISTPTANEILPWRSLSRSLLSLGFCTSSHNVKVLVPACSTQALLVLDLMMCVL